MATEKNYTPDWENSYRWDEQEWERALKYSDHLAYRYFRMLDRFGDLPHAEDVIAAKLGEHNFLQFDEYDEYVYEDGDELDDLEKALDFERSEEFDFPNDSFYYESCPVYQGARQITLGWCNVVASVLHPNDRFWGVRILFYFGRILSYLSLGIGDGTYEHLNGNIIFAKRALHLINVILGELELQTTTWDRYHSVFNIIRKRLLDTQELLVNYLLDCKKRQKDNKAR